MSTKPAVILRTTGKTNSRQGKANTHDSPQALSQMPGVSGDSPKARKVLINETIKVIKMDSKSGITQAAQRAGNLGRPKIFLGGRFEEFIKIS